MIDNNNINDFIWQRREAASLHEKRIGIDYIDVKKEEDELLLFLYFIPSMNAEKNILPEKISPINVQITAGYDAGTVSDIRVIEVEKEETRLLVRARKKTESSDISSYRLELVNIPDMDTFFSGVSFSLQKESELDPAHYLKRETDITPNQDIDYLGRDYKSFISLIRNRISLLSPAWKEQRAADIGSVITEILAYTGDYLSYYQDAVATEAYLGTARRRISASRHARLLDYFMHEGCNARLLVHIDVFKDTEIGKGTPFITKLSGYPERISKKDYTEDIFALKPQIFESMHPARLFKEHNEMRIYTWGAFNFSLKKGATAAALLGVFSKLQIGDILIFEENKGRETGKKEDADPKKRCAVRLAKTVLSSDPLGKEGEENITNIEWHTEDALPFDFAVTSGDIKDITTVLGNIVLADHGRTVNSEKLPDAPYEETYAPTLKNMNLTYSEPYDNVSASLKSVSYAIKQNERLAVPNISLKSVGESEELWHVRRDLLDCDRFSRAFAVEVGDKREAILRFGDDKQGKKAPGGASFTASYRIGNGLKGNIGRDGIAHISADAEGIISVRNPLSGSGGVEPENIEEVKLKAPRAFHYGQDRCVTKEDYITKIESHPEVKKAAAVTRWTGSWYAMFLAVDRKNGVVDSAFSALLRAYMEKFRLAGVELVIKPPKFAPMDISMTVRVSEKHFRSSVEKALKDVFSNDVLPDGELGFFHPDNFTFGKPLYMSHISTKAMEIPGVEDVEITKFKRWGRFSGDEIDKGIIRVGPLEIVRLDNDGDYQGNGNIAFSLKGGI